MIINIQDWLYLSPPLTNHLSIRRALDAKSATMTESLHQQVMGPPSDMAYRTPAVLPFELIQHIGIFFEENLCPSPPTLLWHVAPLTNVHRYSRFKPSI